MCLCVVLVVIRVWPSHSILEFLQGGGSYVDSVSTLPMLEEGYPSCGFRLETLTPVISASLIVILNREIFVVFFRSILKGICKLHLPFFSPTVCLPGLCFFHFRHCHTTLRDHSRNYYYFLRLLFLADCTRYAGY